MTRPVDLPRPFLVLTGYSPYAANRLPASGRFAFASEDAFIVGLPWGKGDPAAARLQCSQWAVIRIEEGDDCRPAHPEGADLVAVRSGTVAYRGAPRGALECLLLAGALPAHMSVGIVIQDDNGIADAGDFSIAVAGDGCRARAGAYGWSQAGGEGLAIAGANGRALAGNFGIAVAGASGCAQITEPNGTAIARGAHGSAEACADNGVAVAMKRCLSLSVGRHGRAIAPFGARNIDTGANAVVVLGGHCDDHCFLRAGAGTLLVYRPVGSDGAPGAPLVAISGKSDVRPDETYVATGGRLLPLGEWQARTQRKPALEPAGAQPDRRRTDPWAEVKRIAPAADLDRSPGDIAGCQAVLMPLEASMETTGDIEAGPADSPFAGLFWGRGDPDAVRLASCADLPPAWAVVLVWEALPAGSAAGGPVRFRKGQVIYRGGLAGALKALEALANEAATARGAPPFASLEAMKLACRVKEAGDFGIAALDSERPGWARAGEGGWAIAEGLAEAGSYGTAQTASQTAAAGDFGIALAGEAGEAIAGCSGIAVSGGDRHGLAMSNDNGLSLASGAFKTVRAGSWGIALDSPGSYGNDIRALDFGTAIGCGRIHAGRQGMAVDARLNPDGHGAISGGQDCLLVAFDGRQWLSAVVGQGDVVANVRYEVRDGAFRRALEPC